MHDDHHHYSDKHPPCDHHNRPQDEETFATTLQVVAELSTLRGWSRPVHVPPTPTVAHHPPDGVTEDSVSHPIRRPLTHYASRTEPRFSALGDTDRPGRHGDPRGLQRGSRYLLRLFWWWWMDLLPWVGRVPLHDRSDRHASGQVGGEPVGGGGARRTGRHRQTEGVV